MCGQATLFTLVGRHLIRPTKSHGSTACFARSEAHGLSGFETKTIARPVTKKIPPGLLKRIEL